MSWDESKVKAASPGEIWEFSREDEPLYRIKLLYFEENPEEDQNKARGWVGEVIWCKPGYIAPGEFGKESAYNLGHPCFERLSLLCAQCDEPVLDDYLCESCRA